MKLYLQSILIVLVAMIISAFLIAGMIWGIKLIIDGWQVVEEMGELLLVKQDKMTKPIDGEKRWVKRKGCKNCAKQWVVDGIDEDGEEYGRWFVVPMTPR